MLRKLNTHRAAAKKPKKVSKYSKRKVDPAFYWMTIPAMILVCIFLYLPFLQGAMYSFTNSQGYGDYKFIGLKNYIALFQDNRVGHAYLFTFLIAILITVLINVIALFLSVLLNSKIAFKNGFRAIFFIPYTLSVLVIGYVFKYIFMNPLPELGKALGIKWLSTSLLTNEQLSWIPIVFLAVWQGIAYSVLIYLAGLQTIDDEIYEAAAIDGCGPLRTYFSVVFPMLRPTMISVGILEIMWVWNDYLLPYLVLDSTKYKTIPIHIQYLKGSYGTVDLGATMALIFLSIVPVIIFYLCCQKHIIKGVAAGAVKG